MDEALQEIMEIPYAAGNLLTSKSYDLPLHVPYLGMGSSYFAPLCFKYMGIDIQPEIASEYFYYSSKRTYIAPPVIISQSGKSSESLWCAGLFKDYVALSNDENSILCNAPAVSLAVPLLAGSEKYSSSKTYVNTLLALFKGHGTAIGPAIQLLEKKFNVYESKGKEMADTVFGWLQDQHVHGIYITGSGPNVGTALQAALILSETTKLSFQGLQLAQYDHGPKETAEGSIVINIVAKGPSNLRTHSLIKKIEACGARILLVEEPDASENMSVLYNIIPFNFMAYYLAKRLNIADTFLVGGKVTEVE